MGLFDAIFGGSESTTVSNPSSVFGPQVPFLQAVYQQALNELPGNIATAGGLEQQMQGFAGQLGSGAGQQITPLLGRAPVNQQIRSLTGNLNRNFDLGLNQIQSRFGQAGTVGSRTGVASGELLGNQQRALAGGISSILGNAFNAQLGGSIAQAGIQSEGAQAALGPLGLQGIFGMNQAPLQAFQQGIGPPAILGGGGQASSSGTPGILGGVGLNFLLGG